LETIVVRGARIHNLKHVDVTIPKGKFVVVTGVSGSGKSSLAFDLLFEEGRKRYLQSVGLNMGTEQDEFGELFDEISGLPPAIAVEQRTIRQTNPRSIVGTKTKMLDYVKWLYTIEGRNSRGEKTKFPVDTFSFGSLAGMCRACHGRGYITQLNVNKMMPDHEKTVGQICNRLGEFARKLHKYLYLLGKNYRFDWQNELFISIPDQAKHAFLYGDKDFEGLLPFAKRTMERTVRSRIVGEIRLCSTTPCADCNGYRVNETARSITVNGMHIGQLSEMPINRLYSFITELETANFDLSAESKPFLRSLQQQCKKMYDVGLSYLTLLRSLPTLSGGELQRLFLMYHLQTDFDSLLYIFDEPTAGLHEMEKASLLKHLKSLTTKGNTVIVVEHDANVIRQADFVIEIGPGAGKEGGKVIFQGEMSHLLVSGTSILAPYLSGVRSLPKKDSYRPISITNRKLTLRGANLHNLSNLTAEFPLGVMIGVAGCSGSGKSSLISGSLVPLLQYCFETESEEDDKEAGADSEKRSVDELGSLEGWEQLKKCVIVSQAPIGRTSMSTPVTYVGIWDKIRDIYAVQPLSIQRSYSAGHFSFNTDEGACPDCNGEGSELIELGPLGHMRRICVVCNGKRYKAEILEVTYKGYSIHQALNATVDEAIALYEENKTIVHMLRVLNRVGLGYLSLGQSATTLSGGEAQRIKLAKELGKALKPNSLYVLDEPTTGLSCSDVEKLMLLLNELTEQGNTVIITEHDAAILSYCDWLIEIGPGGGAEGGTLVAVGTPADLKLNPISLIGPYLSV
jgi:excinuclease ABC subunit A